MNVDFKHYDRDRFSDCFVDLITKYHPRSDWKAAPPFRKDPVLKHPIKYVVFSSIEVTGEDSKRSSAEIVKAIQQRDMHLGMSDIQCNFIVTEEGHVWEGRGWDVVPGGDSDYPGYEGKFCEITNVGNFKTDKVRKATAHLVDIGILYFFLEKDIIQLGPDKRRKGVIVPPCPFEKTDPKGADVVVE